MYSLKAEDKMEKWMKSLVLKPPGVIDLGIVHTNFLYHIRQIS